MTDLQQNIMYSNSIYMDTNQLSPDSYVMKFGKYKGMLITDIANIRIIDKNNKERKEGLRYLKWLCKTQKIVEQVISQYIDDDDEKEEVKPKLPKKKEPKEPKASKNVSIKLKPDDESTVLSFD